MFRNPWSFCLRSYCKKIPQVAGALQAELSANERANINQKPTENVAAYDFYLRGWGLYQLYQKEENEKAIDLFKQAIEADPKFALAYAGLADAYIERVQRFHGEDFWSDSAVDLCQQAVALDPKEVRGYTELARALLNKGWNAKAHEPIRKALELNPNDWRANRFAADELFGTARYDEMYVYLRKCYAEIRMTPTRLVSWATFAGSLIKTTSRKNGCSVRSMWKPIRKRVS
jgi:tetratricopeptide (TPR) repeat protein